MLKLMLLNLRTTTMSFKSLALKSQKVKLKNEMKVYDVKSIFWIKIRLSLVVKTQTIRIRWNVSKTKSTEQNSPYLKLKN